MMRTIYSILSIGCIVTVLAEAAAIGWFASSGRMTPEVVRELKDILNEKSPSTAATAPDPADEQQTPVDDVMKERVLRLFDLGRREEELAILRNLVTEQSTRVSRLQAELELKQKTFEKRLSDLTAENEEAAVQQSRAILQSLQPAEAAETLMGLTIERSLVVVKGMPEKVIGRILKELSRGDDKRMERGQKLFEALSDGEPTRALIDSSVSGESVPNPTAP